MISLFRYIGRRPWLWVVLAFILLIAAWTTIIILCRNVPVEIEAKPAPPPALNSNDPTRP